MKTLLPSLLPFLLLACNNRSSMPTPTAKDCQIMNITDPADTDRRGRPLVIGYNFVCFDSVSVKKIHLADYPTTYKKLDLPRIQSDTRFLNYQTFYQGREKVGEYVFDIEGLPDSTIEEKTQISLPPTDTAYLVHAIGSIEQDSFYKTYLALHSIFTITGLYDTTDMRTRQGIAYEGKLDLYNAVGEKIVTFEGENSLFDILQVDTTTHLMAIRESGKVEQEIQAKLMIYDLKARRIVLERKGFSTRPTVKKVDDGYFLLETKPLNTAIPRTSEVFLYDLQKRQMGIYVIPKEDTIDQVWMENRQVILHTEDWIDRDSVLVNRDTIPLTAFNWQTD